MKQTLKKNLLFSAGILFAHFCHAQWTAQDSLKLKDLLEGHKEIKINEEALKSINLGSPILPANPKINKNYLQFDATLPTTPGEEEKGQPKLGVSLQPYSGATKYNYDPIYKKKISLDQKKGRFVGPNGMPGAREGGMSGTRFMMMKGNLSGGFNTNFENLFSKNFWDFQGRKTTKRTLLALNAYANSEKTTGHYEYYHVDDEEYTVEFAGSDTVQEGVQIELKEHYQVQKGLLYFKYTDFAKGDFTYFRPNRPDVKGVFTTNGTTYRLSYDYFEFIITISRMGGRYYKIKYNLTQKFQTLYSSKEVEKVLIITMALKISSGSDRR